MGIVTDLVAGRTASLELDTFLPYRLSMLSSLAAQVLATVHAPRGLNRSEWVVLTSIAEQRQTSAKQIGALFHMQKAKVSRAVAGLLERGLITRRPNPGDHRLALLELTPRGQELYRECAPAAAAFGRQLEASLDVADREVLLRCLAKLADTAQLLTAEAVLGTSESAASPDAPENETSDAAPI
jgi:DNA-binding MarR family transcriptional regulator